MWSARGAYRNADGQLITYAERSPLWTSKQGLIEQLLKDHPDLTPWRDDHYAWVDPDGVERYVLIEEHE